MADNSNIIIMEDFNIHIDNLEDENLIQFLEMIEVMCNASSTKCQDTHTQRWSYSGWNIHGDEQQSSY